MRPQTTTAAILVLLATQVSGAANVEPLEFSSGRSRVALVELYTSEGCSSCPPADQWLSKLRNDRQLWRDYVPIAFHVDYWDYIGWQDRFADGAYSDRQRQYQREGGTGVVYTPGFFNNGEEWRDWRYRDNSLEHDPKYAGNLSLEVSGDTVAVQFDNQRLGDVDLDVHIAILGMNEESDVRAGENTGRKLKHDFVALSLVSVPLSSSSAGFSGEANIQVPGTGENRKALVAWISRQDSQAPIQAVGGYLPR